MADDKANVEVTGTVTDVTAKFKQVEKTAEKTGKAVESAFAKAAKSVQQSQMVSQLETVSALFIQMGGNVSRVASITTSLIRPVATLNAVLGSTGGSALVAAGAFGALTVAAGAYVLGVRGLVNSAVEARSELVQLGHTDAITQEQAAALDDYTTSARALTTTIDELQVALGARLAPSMTRMNGALITAASTSVTVRGALGEVESALFGVAEGGGVFTAAIDYATEKTEGLRRALIAISTAGSSELLAGVSGHFDSVADSAARAAIEAENYKKKLDEAAKYAQSQAEAEDERRQRSIEAGNRQIEAALRKREAAEEAARRKREREAEAEAEREERARQKRIAGWEAETEKIIRLHMKEAEARRQINAQISAYEYARGIQTEKIMQGEIEAAEAGVAAIKQLEAAWDEYNGSAQQMIDVLKETQDYWQPYVDAADEALTNVISFMEMEADADLDLYEKKKSRLEDLFDIRMDLQRRLSNANSQATRDAISGDLAETNAKVANVRAQEAAYRKQAYDAWKRNKALQIAQNFINQQAAFGMTLANSSIPYPWNMLAAGTAATAVATGLAEIVAAKPPEFPTGRSPDHSEVVALQPGEPVLSRRAAASLGGVDAVRALNEGRMPGGGSVTLDMSPELRRLFRTQRSPRLGKGVRR